MIEENLEILSTETPNVSTENLDLMSSLEFVKVMNDENLNVFRAIDKALPNIAAAVDIVAAAFNAGGRLFYAGAGTSGRLGLMDAVECVPTFGVSADMVVGLIAGGDNAFVKAAEGAEDSLTLCVDDLKARGFCDRDVFCGIAASGRTPYVIGGLDYANSIGAQTIAIACNTDTAIGKKAKVAIEVDAGSEVLTGSTRLKAGTVQKIILNMISTGAMIQTGKVYKNLMVYVLTTNEKLVARARRIVMRAAGVDYATADAALKVTTNKAKPAIVMLLNKCGFEEATAILAKNGGFIRMRN